MKKTTTLVALAALFSIPAFAQTVALDPDTKKYQAQAVEEFKPELTKLQLLGRASEWIAKNPVPDYKLTLQSADTTSGRIVLSGSIATKLFMKPGTIDHHVVLEFKDGRMRYTFSGFSYSSLGSGTLQFESNSLGFKKKMIAETEEKLKTAMAGLKAQLDGAAVAKNDNW